jgi:hypothetical protein
MICLCQRILNQRKDERREGPSKGLWLVLVVFVAGLAWHILFLLLVRRHLGLSYHCLVSSVLVAPHRF